MTEGDHVVPLNEEIVDVATSTPRSVRLETEDVAVDEQVRKESVAMANKANLRTGAGHA